MAFNRHRSRVAAQLTKTMGGFFRQGHLTDVVVNIESSTFNCHKLVLAASSPVFDKMLSSEFKEKQEGQVTLREISPDIFEIILSYLYNEDDRVCGDNVHELLKAACMFQIDSVRDRCENFLVAHLTAKNCCELLKLARTLSCENLYQRTFKCMLKKFPKLSRSKSFLEVEKSDLVKLVSHNHLRVVSEYDVAIAVVNWIKANVESRSELVDIIEHVWFPLMTADQIFQIQILELPLLEKNLDCLRILDEAKRYHLLPFSRHTFAAVRCTPRVAMAEALYFPIGISVDNESRSEGSDEKIITLYDLLHGVWRRLQIGSATSLMNVNNKVMLVTKPSNDLAQVKEMDWTIKRQLKSTTQSIFGQGFNFGVSSVIHSGHSPGITSQNVVLFYDGLYLVALHANTERIYNYDKKFKEPKLLISISDTATSPQLVNPQPAATPLLGQPQIVNVQGTTPLRCQATAAIHSKLYIFGRRLCSNVAGIQCMSMNNEKGTVSDVGEVPGNPENMLTITQDQTIIIVCSGGNVFRLTEDDKHHANIEHAFSIENLGKDFSAAIYQGCLYLATPEKELRQFDITSGKLLSTKPIPYENVTLGMCGTINVPKKGPVFLN